MKVTKWRDIAIDWLATSPKLLVVHYEHLLKDPEIQLRRIIAFLGLEADAERFSCMAGRRFERFSGFLCVFVFMCFVRFEKFLRKSTPLKKAVFWASTAVKVMLMFTCF